MQTEGYLLTYLLTYFTRTAHMSRRSQVSETEVVYTHHSGPNAEHRQFRIGVKDSPVRSATGNTNTTNITTTKAYYSHFQWHNFKFPVCRK